ncbi:MerR family DNA-binding transcriptional regulator [Candidatus Shapirobacteria bacterium]|nr:MerR family DNA-binding transcriptional regulator [Candidatus Shapirobacteria bacterium]
MEPVGWAKIKPISKYAGVSVRTLRAWLKQGLIHSRLPGGCILIQYGAVDKFLGRFQNEENKAEKIVEKILNET